MFRHGYARSMVPICLLCLVFLAGCATQPEPTAYDPPGFWSGLLHGFLILFSLIGSLFTDVRIYAFPNSGGWYDFGYLIGASMFLGGGAASASHDGGGQERISELEERISELEAENEELRPEEDWCE